MKNLYLLLFVFTIISCSSDDNDIPIIDPAGDYTNGMFILNEGGFGYSNASVSFLDENQLISNNIFSNTNNKGLGDTAQSMGLYEDRAYIIVNNSSTIEVVDRYTFESITTIENQISHPRYIVFYENKAFISNWGDPNDITDDYIAVLDLETNQVINKISVPEGPEKLLIDNAKIYVAHKGGHGYGNTISVIDAASENLNHSIEVGDVPDAMQVKDEILYVMCSGKPDYTQDESIAGIYKINLSTSQVHSWVAFPEGDHPAHLEIHDKLVYYTIGRNIYTRKLNHLTRTMEPIFSGATYDVQVLYGFKIENEKIYLSDAKDYTSNGEVLIIGLQGGVQQRFPVQIIPNSFYFNW